MPESVTSLAPPGPPPWHPAIQHCSARLQLRVCSCGSEWGGAESANEENSCVQCPVVFTVLVELWGRQYPNRANANANACSDVNHPFGDQP